MIETVISAAGVNGWVLGLWIAAAVVFLLDVLYPQLVPKVRLVSLGLALTVIGLLVEAATTVHSINW